MADHSEEESEAVRRSVARLPLSYLRYRALRWRWKRPAESRRSTWRARRRDGLVMEVDEHDVIDFMLLHFGVWEPGLTALIAAHLRHGDCAVDIGANIGAHALTMARSVGPSGRVLALEPAPDTYARLRANLEANNLAHVDALQKAASDEAGVITLFDGEDASRGRATIAPDAEGRAARADVEMIRTADAWPAEHWSRARFIKIDVERAEDRVLRGLAPVLHLPPADCVWVIECEPQAMAARGATLEDLLAPRVAQGAQFYRLDNAANLKAMMRPRPPLLEPCAPSEVRCENASDFVLALPAVAARWFKA